MRYWHRCGGFAGVLFLLAVAAQAQTYRPDWKNRLAPFVPSPQHAVEKMLSLADLKPGETVYDLGCGDGRILITAAQQFHANAVGVEISDQLVEKAKERAKSLGLTDKIKVIHGDMMNVDFSGADVVTLYLMTGANKDLRPNLEKFLKKDARVVSYDYPIPGWNPVGEEETAPNHLGNRHTIYLYQVPISLKK